MLPASRITISRKNGTAVIEVMEKSETCSKYSDMSKRAGKVLSDEEKEHTPVFHDVGVKN